MAAFDDTALTCEIGFTWAQEFRYWDDVADTEAHDFTGFTLDFVVIHQSGTTTEAEITVTGNVVVAALGAVTTGGFHKESAKYLLTMVSDSNPNDKFPLGAGRFYIEKVV